MFVLPDRAVIMGVVNVTPDSFSDGGTYLDPAAAIAHGRRLRADGADVLDVGGEATNPRAHPVDAAEELRRILPVIAALAADGAVVSVDTTKASVARAAVAAGACIVNDVSGGLFDPDMPAALDALDAVYIAGHLRGTSLAAVFAREASLEARGPKPEAFPWTEVADELAARLAALSPRVRARTWVDPGLGFGKGSDPAGNLALIRHAGDLGTRLGVPVVVGPSRKRFITRIANTTDPRLVDVASVTAGLAAIRCGARVVRIHDVAALRAAISIDAAIW